VDWDDLEAESQALRDAQDAIERQIEALTDDPPERGVSAPILEDVKQHAERLSRFVEALIRLRQ